jgi:hypothetical protein
MYLYSVVVRYSALNNPRAEIKNYRESMESVQLMSLFISLLLRLLLRLVAKRSCWDIPWGENL